MKLLKKMVAVILSFSMIISLFPKMDVKAESYSELTYTALSDNISYCKLSDGVEGMIETPYLLDRENTLQFVFAASDKNINLKINGESVTENDERVLEICPGIVRLNVEKFLNNSYTLITISTSKGTSEYVIRKTGKSDYSALEYRDISNNQNNELETSLKGSQIAVLEGELRLNLVQYQNVGFNDLYLAVLGINAENLVVTANGQAVETEGTGIFVRNAKDFLTYEYNVIKITSGGGNGVVVIYCPENAGAGTYQEGVDFSETEEATTLEVDTSTMASTTLSNPRKDSSGNVIYDCVWFGSYPQSDATGVRKDPIKWRVLEVNGDDAFIVADCNLDVQKYNDTHTDVTWETCTMRKWLNSDFMNRAFTSSEQSAIKMTNVVNEDNPEYGTEGGNDTQDKMFLLSLDEVMNEKYGFSSDNTTYDNARKRKNTAYAAKGGTIGSSFMENEGTTNWWWLRSPGNSSDDATYVSDDGNFGWYGYYVDFDRYNAVCPALHLNLSSSNLWSYAGIVSSDGTVTSGENTTEVVDREITIFEPTFAFDNSTNTKYYELHWNSVEGAATYTAYVDVEDEDHIATAYHNNWSFNKTGQIHVDHIAGKPGHTQKLIIVAYDDKGTLIARGIKEVTIPELTEDEKTAAVTAKLNSEDNYAKGATAIVSSGNFAQDIVDGNINTRWQASIEAENHAVGSEFFGVNLGSVKTIGQVVIAFEAAYAATYDVYVAGSDEVYGDTPVASGTADMDNLISTVNFDEVEAQYVKVLVTEFSKYSSVYGTSVYELGVFLKNEEETTIPTEPSTTPVKGEKPSTPTGLVQVSGADGTLPFHFAWTPVEGAISYNVYLNAELIETVINTDYFFDKELFVSAGDYIVEVAAVKDGLESDKANIICTVKTDESEETIIDYSSLTYTKIDGTDMAVASMEDFPIQDVINLGDRVYLIPGVGEGDYPVYPDYSDITINGQKNTSVYSEGAGFVIPTDGTVLKDDAYNIIEATSAIKNYKFHIVIKKGTPPNAENPETTQTVEDTSKENEETSTKISETTTQIITPEQVRNFNAIGEIGKIALTWSKASEVDTNIYKIYRRSDASSEYNLIKTINGRDILSYEDTDVEDQVSYEYVISCVNKYGNESKKSSSISAQTLLDTEPPMILKLYPNNMSVLTGKAEFSVLAQDNYGVSKIEYSYSVDDGETWNPIINSENNILVNTAGLLNNSKTAVLDTTMLEAKNIKVKACAVDYYNNRSSEIINSYYIDNEGPDKVIGVTDTTYTSVSTLVWKDVLATDKHHFILQEVQGENYVTIADNIDKLGYILKGLQPNTSYIYRIACVDRYGNLGEWSDNFTIHTLKDENEPVITNQSPMANRYNKSITFSVSAKDDCAVSSIAIQVSTDLQKWTEIAKKQFSGNETVVSYSKSINLSEYEEGSVYVRGIASDSSGNMSKSDDKAPYIEYIVDKTAPEVPGNIQAVGNNGFIEVKWNDVSDDDRDRYFIYRSETEDGTYKKIASELSTLNYIDRNVVLGQVYYYKVSVDDKCDNMSKLSESSHAQVKDDIEKPVIESVGPENGESLSEEYSKVKALVKDNCCLSDVLIEYKVNEEEKYTVLSHVENINTYYKNISASIPVSLLSDGDEIFIRISAVDKAGNKSEYVFREYTIDKMAPEITDFQYGINKNQINLSWKDVASKDLSGHKIYRSINGGSYSLVATRKANRGEIYTYSETVSNKGIYKYKVVTYDELYNSSYKLTEEMEYVVENSAPVARITGNTFMEVGVEEYFDASLSYDDENIVEYLWEFGDGTTSDKIKSVKKYNTAGEYTVKLHVKDNHGLTTTETRDVIVKEKEELGTLAVKVCDDEGNVVPFADIYIDLGSDRQKILSTDVNGSLSVKLPMGNHLIGMYESGYLPVKMSVNVLARTTRNITLTTSARDIVTGAFEVKEMDFDEIVAAGIDTKDPANYQTYKATVRVTYGTSSFDIGYIRNDTEIIKTYIPDNTFTTVSGEDRKIGGIVYIPTSDKNNEIVAILDIPAKATFLKEFFDVNLHIINNASAEFELINNEITLHVPDGMTLMNTVNGNYSHNNVVNIPKIIGQEQKTISWVLRGDKAGEYDLSADFTGELKDFGTQINTVFKTDESQKIKVFGLDGVEFSIEPDKKMYEGAVYFNVGLKNERDKNLYLPNINIDGKISNVLSNEKNSGNIAEDIKVNLLKVYVQNADGAIHYYDVDYNNGGKLMTAIEKLEPKQRMVYQYVAYNITDNDDTAYLQDSIITNFEGLGNNIVVKSSSVNDYVGEFVEKLESDDNFAKGKKGFASSKSLELFEANQAFDGNLGTRWMAKNNQDGQFVGVDLGTEIAVDEVVIAWEKAYAKSYQVYTSTDGNDYKLVSEVTARNSEIKSIQIPTTRARYVKVVCDGNPLPYGTSIWDIGVFGQAYSEEIIEIERVVEVDPQNEDLEQIKKAVKYQMGLVLKKKQLLGDTQIGVPGVELGGFNLNLLSIQAKVGMDLGKTNYSVVVDTDTKTILVKAGFKDSSSADVVQTTDMCSASWSEQYKAVKKFYKFIDGRDLKTRENWNDFQKMKASLNQMGCDLFLSADMNVAGYLEFDYSSGKIKFSEGGMIASAGVGVEMKFPLVTPPIVYTTLGLKGDIKGSIIVKSESTDIINTQLNFEPSITATAKVTATIGLASAEAGVDAGLAAKISNEENPLVVTMSGNIFANVRLLTKTWPFTKQYLDTQLYPKQAGKMSIKQKDFTDESSVDIQRANTADGTNEYQYSDVKMACLPSGKQVMMWVSDDAAKADINRTVLKYKIYSDGKWSEAKTLADDGTAIGEFQICSSGDKVYVVYQKANKVFENDVTVSEMLKNIDLYMQMFDGTEFSAPKAVKSDVNENYEVIKSIQVDGSKVNIVWAENTENEILIDRGLTKICKRSFYNNMWSDEVELLNNNAQENKNFVSETVSASGNVLYYIKYNSDTEKYLLIKENDGYKKVIVQSEEISNLQMMNDTLFFIMNKSLYSYKDDIKNENLSNISNFKILTNSTKTVLVTNVATMQKSELYYSEYTGTEWTDLMIFAETETYIRSYSPVLEDDGNINVWINSITRDEKGNEVAKLVNLSKEEKNDLQLMNVYYDESDIIPGKQMKFSVDVYNNSSIPVENMKIYIKSQGETLSEKSCDGILQSGGNGTYEIVYNVPKEFTKKQISVEVTSGLKEENYQNNIYSTFIGYADLEMSDLMIKEDEKHNYIATASVQNVGYELADSVAINIHSDGTKETLYDTVMIGKIDIGEKINVEWTINEELLRTKKEGVYNAIIFSAISETEEMNYINNDEKIVYESLIPHYNVIVDGNIVETLSEGEVFTLGEAEFGYYCEGKMYPAGYNFAVRDDVEFESVNELSVNMTYGAAIRMREPSGLAFEAKVNCDKADVLKSQSVISQGMLITANDLLESSQSQLLLNSSCIHKNIINSGWYKEEIGRYRASIVNIVPSNYIRSFVARAYVTVNYIDGTETTIYSRISSERSVAYVAERIAEAGYPNLSEEQIKVINSYLCK